MPVESDFQDSHFYDLGVSKVSSDLFCMGPDRYLLIFFLQVLIHFFLTSEDSIQALTFSQLAFPEVPGKLCS